MKRRSPLGLLKKGLGCNEAFDRNGGRRVNILSILIESSVDYGFVFNY